MLAFLEGTIAHKGQDRIYLSVGGVGYDILMAQRSISTLPPVGEDSKVLCYLAVTDSSLTLYGFVSEDEKSIFDNLTDVSGIGPKTALAALSAFSPGELAAAISNEDVKAVSRIPGVGKKSASRIILELKDRFETNSIAEGLFAPQAADASVAALVTLALRDLGFTDAETSSAMEGSDPSMDEKALLQYALRRLGR